MESEVTLWPHNQLETGCGRERVFVWPSAPHIYKSISVDIKDQIDGDSGAICLEIEGEADGRRAASSAEETPGPEWGTTGYSGPGEKSLVSILIVSPDADLHHYAVFVAQ